MIIFNDFYVYSHHKANTDKVFYIGKGRKERDKKKCRSKHWNNIVNKHGLTIKRIHENLLELEAMSLEIKLIKEIGRLDLGTGPLINLTDGGEGLSGFVRTPENRLKLSLANLGKKNSPESNIKRSIAHKGKSHNSTWNANVSAAVSGVPKSDSHKESLKVARNLRPGHSDETKALMSKTRKGRPLSDVNKKNLSLAHIGKPKSETHRASLRVAWIRRKEAAALTMVPDLIPDK